jgi:hypothetical protein
MIHQPKTPVERLLWAYQFGHSWNRDAKYANLRNLDSGRILKMDGSEADAKLLIASWQDFEPNVARLVEAYHGREVQPDGGWGPASEAAANIRRCAMTDFAPPAGAELSFWADEGLRGALESYQRYAAAQNNDAEYVGGTGSWPKGCDPLRKDVHSTRINVITAGFSEHQRALFKECHAAVEACEAEIGQACRHILDGDPQEAEHDIRGQYIAGGVIGYNYFPQANTCNQVLVGRIDNSFNASKYTLAELYQHEYKGHGDGLEHVSRTASQPSIMHPSISTPSRWPTWRGDRHEPTKRRYFGGVAIPQTPKPDDPKPPPTPNPGGPGAQVGTLVLAGATYTVHKQGAPLPPDIVV